ncbi:Hypothetical predicted protein [Mytilus galloprovincialis]|uniref:Uncharacterized protein n=1 Tax=Mytilus galloprovincialis TaxID=29158 RepID=A0A8B6E0S2_MYTGA|nr:Hypothetical predicted protein [Mytilus galloprovincialis]
MSSKEDVNTAKVRRSNEQLVAQKEFTIRLLTEAITIIKTVSKGTNIAKLIGKFVSLLGTGGLVLGLFIAPVTSGMSLVYCVIPAGLLSLFGSVTASAASIVYLSKQSDQLELAHCALKKDKDAMTKHKEVIEDFMKENRVNDKIVQWVSKLNTCGSVPVVYTAGNGFLKFGNVICTINNAVPGVVESSQISVRFSDATEIKAADTSGVKKTGFKETIGKTSFRTLVGTDEILSVSRSALKKTLPIAILSMCVDIYQIIQTSIEMKTENKSLVCGKLQQMCEQLEMELEEMKKMEVPHVPPSKL